MKVDLVPFLRSPDTGGALELQATEWAEDEVVTGTLVSSDGRFSYAVRDGVPRFVPEENYASSFGYQWNRFRRTQLDSHSGLPISRQRFYRFSGWQPAELEGRTVLDVGCGAGRFTEIALDAGARVIAVDYSSAVDACWRNHRHRAGLHVVQADVYRLPFEPARFDFVFCFGVLQHTPDPRAAFLALAEQVAGGGRIAIDIYPKLRRNLIWPKYWLRPLTRRIPQQRLLTWVERVVPVLLPISITLGRIPLVGRHLKHAVPVANYDRVYPLSRPQLREWAILDTFDMLAPAHDHPQTADAVRSWFAEARLESVSVERMGFLVGRGRKSPTAPPAGRSFEAAPAA